MCELYASTDPSLYEVQSRSLRLQGQVTSVRLERRFWQLLDEMADGEGRKTSSFIAELQSEVTQRRGEVGNLASLLRVVCTTYLERRLSQAVR
ncbi:ribbon-helix-helix domain-containing protein [Crenobacter intestini]|uniref:DNA-binding protein n=1 Tax=Crenobacter intestini TaxID=2563443 RepID=A0A4T0V5C5_9NEIS|nr:ribbon-helix-helix domain-containing protein [Crenobacter intestini]TIC86950.1 DNA-binding protein [Crenobacter intestini]